MSKNTVTLKVSRSKYIEESKDIALIRLDTIQHIVGQPVMINYYATNGDLETITAIGVKDGVGRDCYSIVSTSKESIVNNVYEELPDVSELVHGARYICKLEDKWSIVRIDDNNNVRLVETLLDNDPQIIKELETGFRWFYVNGKFKREDDFLQENEVRDVFIEELYKIHNPTITAELKDKSSFFIIGQKITDPVFNIHIIDHSGNDITSECSFSFTATNSEGVISIKKVKSQLGNLITIYDTLKDYTKYTITAKYNLGDMNLEFTMMTEVVIKFGYYSYYGKLNNPENININDLTKVAWNGEKELSVKNIDLVKNYLVVLIPAEYSNFNKILDRNELDYIDDYDFSIVDLEIDNQLIRYKKYLLNNRVTINNFKQIFKYE